MGDVGTTREDLETSKVIREKMVKTKKKIRVE